MSTLPKIAPVALALALAACAPPSMIVPTPARPAAFAGFEVECAPSVPSDRRALLESLDVLPVMATALRTAYPTGDGPRVRITITDFSAPRWGRAHMQAVVEVLDPSATAVLRTFDVDGVTPFTRQTRGWYVRRVSQEVVDQIAAQL